MAAPKTNILIRVSDPEMVKDIWKLFDHIISEMEEIGEDGYPLVNAHDRKRFRVEVMRARDGDMMEVFSRWVTILVPRFVPLETDVKQMDGAMERAKQLTIKRTRKEISEDREEKERVRRKVAADKRRQARKLGYVNKFKEIPGVDRDSKLGKALKELEE